MVYYGLVDDQTANEQIRNLKNLPKNFIDILTDQKPGRIFLTPQRRLRALGPNSTLKSAFLLYQSDVQEEEQTPQIQMPKVKTPKVHEPKIDQREKTADHILTYDFIGDVAIAKDEDSQTYLRKQSMNNIFYDDEIIAKIDELQKKYQELDPEKTLIFTLGLSGEDPAFKNARRLGIESIVISGPVVTFIINRDQIYAKEQESKIPLAFTAFLDESGWLEVDATEPGAVPDEMQIAFTNIVLGLLRHQEEISKKVDANTASMAKEQIAYWNRTKRSTFGRLSWNPETESRVLVAIRANSHTIFIPYA